MAKTKPDKPKEKQANKQEKRDRKIEAAEEDEQSVYGNKEDEKKKKIKVGSQDH